MPFDPPFDKTSRYAAEGTADPRMSLSSRSAATRKRGDVYLAGVVAVVKKFDSRFSLIPHPPNLVVKTPSRAHVTSRNLTCFRSGS